MNTLIIAIFVLVATAAAAPLESQPPIPIVSQTLDGPNPDGSYNWSYESANGIRAQEQGQQLNPGTDEAENSVQGSYSYPGEDGNTITVNYIAGKNGFQAEGSHLPQAPAIPEAILRALDWIAAHPEEDNL